MKQNLQFKSFKQKIFLLLTLTLFLLNYGLVCGQTPYSMASGNKTWDLAGTWSVSGNSYSGTDAINWSSVAVIGSGTSVTTGVRTTKSSAAIVTTTVGGFQKPTGVIQFLSSGSTTTPEAVAVDLRLDFTGRVAGTLSYDWAAIDNVSGTRPTSLRVFWSIDGVTFTEISAAQLLDKESATLPSLGSLSSIVLPTAFNGSSTARLRFYNHAGSTTIGAGNRDKMQIDNISVTSSPAVLSPTIATSGSLSSLSTVYGIASSTTQFILSGSNMTAGIVVTPPVGFEVSTTSNFSSNVGSNSMPITIGTSGTISSTIYVRIAANSTVGNYLGNIVLSSSGATSVNLSTNSTNTVISKTVTINGLVANDKVFDNSTSATLSGVPSLVGILSVDLSNVNISGTPVANFNDSSVGVNKPVTVTGYSLSGSAAFNYSLSQPTGLTATINPSTLQNQLITFNPLSSVNYGDSNFTLNATSDSGLIVTYSSSNTNVASVSGNTVTIIGAGTTIITASQVGDSSYNPATNVVQNLVVNQKLLTISGALANNKVYDATTQATITGGILNGIVGLDAVSFSGNGIFDNTNAGVLKTVTGSLVLTGINSSNYSLTQPILNADISQKPLTISGISISNKQYDTTDSATIIGTANLVGIFASDVSNVSVTGTPLAQFINSAVGNGKSVIVSGYVLSGAASTNYSLSQPLGLLANITTKLLTITGLNADNKIYDRSINASLSGTALLSGILIGDELNISLSGTPIASFDTFLVGTNKIVSVSGFSVSGSSLNNYTLSPLNLTANIIKKDVTILGAFVNDKIYDGTVNAVLTGTINGIISPDNLVLNLSATFNNANVGNNKVVISNSTITGLDSSNYNLIQPTGLTANITASLCSSNSGIVTWNFLTASTTSNTLLGLNVSSLSQGNNNGTTTLITTTSPSTYVGASGTNNAGAAVFVNPLNTSTSTYFEFTLTPQSGYNVSLNGFSFGSRSTSTGPQAYTLRSSADGYVANVASGTLINNSVWVLNNPTLIVTTSPLPITYRLFGHSGVGIPGLGSANWRIDDLKLNLSQVPLSPLSSQTSVTSCSNNLFSYTPTTVYSGSTITWTRQAIAGISNSAVTTPQSSNPSEILVNTTNSAVTVIYEFTITTSTCFITQNLLVSVSPVLNWYLDADNDGHYVGIVVSQCISPGIGYNTTATILGDCDDTNALIYQNGSLYIDFDGDGFDSGTSTICYGISVPSGYSLSTLGTDCNDTNALLTNNCSTLVDLKLFIEGYYSGSGAMTSVKLNQDGVSPSTDVETLTIELHDATTPSTIIATTTGMLKTDGTLQAVFTTAPSGSFYVAVKTSNAIETWSANAVTVGSTLATYDFSDLANKAFGDNMKELAPGVFGLYSGDINQDGFIESLDFIPLSIDSDNLEEGVKISDLNGDGFVESLDFPIFFINSDNLIESLHP